MQEEPVALEEEPGAPEEPSCPQRGSYDRRVQEEEEEVVQEEATSPSQQVLHAHLRPASLPPRSIITGAAALDPPFLHQALQTPTRSPSPLTS